MKVDYTMITLVYANIKYVSPTLECICRCGTKTHRLDCYKYGRIHVGCSTCGERATLILNRKVVYDFHTGKFPSMPGLDYFMNSWESDMKKITT